MIVHGHISIGNKKVTIPSYLVKIKEEKDISFAQNSAFANTDHPERATERSKKDEKKPAAKDEKKAPAQPKEKNKEK